jgi:ubiquinone biosynthesis protein COQ9
VDDLSFLCYPNLNATRGDWYTHRAFLLSFYGTSELYMLTDSSDKLEDTK